MGKQRNNTKPKGKEESSGGVINEIKASQLSDSEFQTMVIRKLNVLPENYQKLQGNCKGFTTNYISMKKDIETVNKNQEEMKNTISELKTIVEGIKSRVDEERMKPASWMTR